MKYPVHPCDEIRGIGEHHSRVQFDTLENIGDATVRHPVESIEPTPERVQDMVRAVVVQMMREMKGLTVNQRETVFLRTWGMEWADIAGTLHMKSPQLAEWTLRAAIRKVPSLRTLFPQTNKRRTA